MTKIKEVILTPYHYRREDGRLYRSPSEIKRDIEEVAARLFEINEMLNIRNMISEVISEQSDDEPKRCAEAVSELLDYAAAALCEMRTLSETLEELREELIETVRALG